MNKFETIKKLFLENNLKVFPVMENKKIPLIDEWQNDCSNDLVQIIYWLENAKNCNIGLPANENDLFIIDIDMHNGVNGLASFCTLLNDLGIHNVYTRKQQTPSGGIHFIFKSDDELKEVMNTSNSFEGYPGIDIRTKGYILVEPSRINDIPYSMDNTPINEMPIELKEYILKHNNKKVEENKKEYIKPEKVERGGRDTSLFEYLNYLYFRTRLNKEEIRLLAYHFNQTICEPPLSNGTVDYKVDKLFKKKRNKYILINIGDEYGEENKDIQNVE